MLLSPGQFAPPARVQALDGSPVALESLCASSAALLFFYKSDCPSTAIAAPVLPRFEAVRGLRLAAVSQDDPGATDAFAAANGWTGSVLVLVDPEPWPASDAYRVRSTPTWVLLARGGRVEGVAEGWSREDANALAAAAARLAGAPAPVVARPDGPEPALRPG